MKIFLYSLCILFAACTEQDEKVKPVPIADSVLQERWKIIHSIRDSIREGDLIMRCGNDYTSYTLRDFSQLDPMYSHSGIVLMVDSNLFVYHNMAGDLNPNEIMRRDPIDSFLTPVNNVAFGIYRYDMARDEINGLKDIVTGHYRNKLQFDMNFDLKTDEKMYCSEMIAKGISQATNNRIVFSTSLMNNELKNKYLKMALQKRVIPSAKTADVRRYLALDNLYINPNCHEIYRHIFEKNTGPVSIPPPETDSVK